MMRYTPKILAAISSPVVGECVLLESISKLKSGLNCLLKNLIGIKIQDNILRPQYVKTAGRSSMKIPNVKTASVEMPVIMSPVIYAMQFNLS
jgi:hypothetical protein